METPKTRTLRKRENAEADIGGIEWVCDKTLIYQIKAATREQQPELPTPTQISKPISSRYSPFTKTTQSSLSTPTTRKPCKRPRASKSLPDRLQSLSNPTNAIAGPSSLPIGGMSGTDGESTLEDLLAQGMVLYVTGSRSDSALQVESQGSSTAGTKSGSIQGGASRVGVRHGVGQSDKKDGSASLETPAPVPRVLTARLLNEKLNDDEKLPSSKIGLTIPHAKECRSKLQTAITTQPQQSILNHPKRNTNGNRPVLDENKTISHTTTPQRPRPNNPPFKVPFAATPGIRSSPRRAVAVGSASKQSSGLRETGSIAPPLAHSKGRSVTSSNANPHPSHETAMALNVPSIINVSDNQTDTDTDHRERPRPVSRTANAGKDKAMHNANIDIGENDGEGDSSYDSIDFGEGGADLEAFLIGLDHA